MSYTIRDANHSDTLDIILAVKQFCKEIPHKAWSKVNTTKINQLVSQLIDIEGGFVKLVIHEDEIVGCLIAVATELPINDFIVSQELMFWLDKDHRNGKTSPKLIDAYVEWAKNVGCNFVRLSSIDEILGGKAGILFKRKGFVATETAYIKEF
jgi:GNAT superfamily N-acetyltransferase